MKRYCAACGVKYYNRNPQKALTAGKTRHLSHSAKIRE